MTDNTNIFFYR